MYKSHFHNAAKLNTRMRRAELVAFRSRPDMLLDINFPTAQCHSPSSDTELQFPDPGPDVVEGDSEYPLAEPSC
jgi:hypothetical protein